MVYMESNSIKIAEYLRNSLQKIENGPIKIYKNKTWVQSYGFRRAFQIHGVYINRDTNEHIFHVDEFDWVISVKEPNFGIWESFDSMIDGVSKQYESLWKKRLIS